MFAQDTDLNYNKFVDELLNQHLVEREEYYTELEQTILEHLENSDNPQITIQDLQKAILTVDPDIPHKEQDRLIAYAFNVDVSNLQAAIENNKRIYKADLKEHVHKILKKFQSAALRRYTKKPSSDNTTPPPDENKIKIPELKSPTQVHNDLISQKKKSKTRKRKKATKKDAGEASKEDIIIYPSPMKTENQKPPTPNVSKQDNSKPSEKPKTSLAIS